MTGLRQTLQRLNIATLELDDAIELSASAEQLRVTYQRYQIPSPVLLDDAIRMLDRYIWDKTRDRMEMELRELAQADSADMSASEKRAARQARRQELEARLNKSQQPA